MLAKKIKFEDVVTGSEVTEEFFFVLTKADLLQVAVDAKEEDFSNVLKRIQATNDPTLAYSMFQTILRRAHRELVDGKLIRSEHGWNVFESSEAYSELILEWIQTPDQAAADLTRMLPKAVQDELNRG